MQYRQRPPFGEGSVRLIVHLNRHANVIHSICTHFSFTRPCHNHTTLDIQIPSHPSIIYIYIQGPTTVWVCVVKFLISIVKQTYLEFVSARLTIVNQQTFLVLSCVS